NSTEFYDLCKDSDIESENHFNSKKLYKETRNEDINWSGDKNNDESEN
ncbi:18777_t:CDS:2, partial [Racocetra fulgida]